MSDHDENPKAAGPMGLAGIASVGDQADEPMSSKQADVLRALCDKHGETFDSTLSHDAAAARIAELSGDDDVLMPPQS